MKTKVNQKKKETFNNCNVQYLSPKQKDSVKLLVGINRDVSIAHVNRIVESMQRVNANTGVIVMADLKIPELHLDGRYIIDGQHRFFALVRLNKAIPYMVLKINTTEELVATVAGYNTSSKAWLTEDYIKIWGSFIKDYESLQAICIEYSIDRRIIANLLYSNVTLNANSLQGGSAYDAIRSGRFRIRDVNFCIKILNYIKELQIVVQSASKINKRVMIALMIEKIIKDGGKYSHAKYLKYIYTRQNELMIMCHDESVIRDIIQPKAY